MFFPGRDFFCFNNSCAALPKDGCEQSGKKEKFHVFVLFGRAKNHKSHEGL